MSSSYDTFEEKVIDLLIEIRDRLPGPDVPTVKEPKKAREFWICEGYTGLHVFKTKQSESIHVREVLE